MSCRILFLTLCLGAAAAASPRNRLGKFDKWQGPDDPGRIGKTGGYTRDPTIEFWTVRCFRETFS